ncbi:DUF362 domain-containing protein [uncultured Mailhella sp.]|uniref:DUF362 domain-containing protein n=1 Tax=uncultured Mailhella sp. TaxID=1981031 RepID=UPI0025EF174F|nr:DUF362 domain-containing protein [uncultured Mailhella sp.]
MSISRRRFVTQSLLAAGAVASGLAPALARAASPLPKVYFTRDLSAEGLLRLYGMVNQHITGNIAVKLHTGEPGGPNILPREWVRSFLTRVPGARIVECNVLYASPRQTTEGHRRTLEENGWTEFADVDIMDEDGDTPLPVRGGQWLTEVAVGSHLLNYDSMVVLTHFKGHTMGGFGGSLKNISIGCASGKLGKLQIHRDGNRTWAGGPRFMERMVEGGKAVTDHFGNHITYINVLRNMSVSCDCEGVNAEPVRLPDLGILASTDILAIDKASVDMIYALPEDVRAHMVERIESRSGLRQLSYMKELGMGSDQYELVTVEKS